MPPKRGGYIPKKAIAPPTAISTKPPPKFPVRLGQRYERPG